MVYFCSTTSGTSTRLAGNTEHGPKRAGSVSGAFILSASWVPLLPVMSSGAQMSEVALARRPLVPLLSFMCPLSSEEQLQPTLSGLSEHTISISFSIALHFT